MTRTFKILTFFVLSFFPLTIFAQLTVPRETPSSSLENSDIAGDLDFAKSYTEEISKYDVTIEIQKDSGLIIVENIRYDFKSSQKHGIYRDIPIKYKSQSGANYRLRLKVLSVKDENSTPYKYKTSRKGKDFSIKIGDPDKLVSGKKTYLIKYKVERGMRGFSDHDELYWNAIGHGWYLNILAGKARIILPEKISQDKLKYDCFTGLYGSKEKNCKIEIVDEKTIDFILTKSLGIYNGITIVLGIPKGIIFKSQTKEILWFLQDNWPLLLIPIFFIILFFLWWTRGRDPKGRKIIIAQYDPPDNLRPGEVGVILDQEVDNRDVSATLIDLAVRGYLKIKEVTKNEYQFIKLPVSSSAEKKDSHDLENFEKKLFDDIFDKSETKLLSALKYKFAEKLAKTKDSLYDDLTLKGYFPKNPLAIRSKYLVIGVLTACASFVLLIFFQSWIYFLGFLITGILFIVFSFFMSRRSYKGVLAYEHILGLKEFLSVTERERLKFHQAPEKKPELFERYLPYAMVLGVEQAWAKQFEGVYQQKPSWYESYDARPFAAFAFVNSLTNLSSKTENVFSTAAPKTSSGSFGGSGFGGGGSSGGGGGGGGGGSW